MFTGEVVELVELADVAGEPMSNAPAFITFSLSVFVSYRLSWLSPLIHEFCRHITRGYMPLHAFISCFEL